MAFLGWWKHLLVLRTTLHTSGNRYFRFLFIVSRSSRYSRKIVIVLNVIWVRVTFLYFSIAIFYHFCVINTIGQEQTLTTNYLQFFLKWEICEKCETPKYIIINFFNISLFSSNLLSEKQLLLGPPTSVWISSASIWKLKFLSITKKILRDKIYFSRFACWK